MKYLFILAIVFVLSLASLAAAGTVLDWQQTCASGDYAAIPGTPPAVIIECYLAEETPTPTPEPTPTATYVPVILNQLINPCFDGQHNYDPEYWQQTAGWDVSIRKNPCGENGAAGRMAAEEIHGESAPGIDEYIWQVVPGQGGHLIAEINCTYIGGDVMDYNIYGGPTAEGPWLLVWRPFTIGNCLPNGQWNLQHAETDITAQDWYKVEVHGRFSGQAVKITSMYFESAP